MRLRPGEHSRVDAGRTSLFAFWRRWSGATHLAVMPKRVL